MKDLLCDSGYVGKPLAQGVKDILGEHVTVQIAKRSELHVFTVMLQRWVVGGAQLCVAGEEQAVVQELREAAQHQLAVHSHGFLGSITQKIVNRLLGPLPVAQFRQQ